MMVVFVVMVFFMNRGLSFSSRCGYSAGHRQATKG